MLKLATREGTGVYQSSAQGHQPLSVVKNYLLQACQVSPLKPEAEHPVFIKDLINIEGFINSLI